jgi:hypothetical protein
MDNVMQNVVKELDLTVEGEYGDPFNELKITAEIKRPDMSVLKVPGFWRGGDKWAVRYSSDQTGMHEYMISFSDLSGKTVQVRTGEILIVPYEGNDPLYKHGGIKASPDKKYLMHADGKPFFWLGDTWWMGLTTRLDWPSGFSKLIKDRVEKGFSVVQIIAGLYPDMEPFDDRGRNEAGFPWDRDFKTIDPDYFEAADKKIRCLADSGIVPCIVACWGFFLEFAGKEVIKKQWDNLIARYGAYPVVWCAAGEALMDFYKKLDGRESYTKEEKRAVWSEICRHIHENDPFGRVVTIHPTDFGHKMVDDESVLDLEMLQTGHSGYNSLKYTVDTVREATGRKKLPVINSEVCYEGICGTNFEDIQRYVFWASFLNGTCGHTYGANGIWQLNSAKAPYGTSPHGASWGDTSWEDASKLPGSSQIGLGKKLIERYEWWRFGTHPEWVENHEYFAAGISGRTRIIFIPFFSGFGWGNITVKDMEKGIRYKACYFDPILGDIYDLGIAEGDADGNWKSGRFTKFQDWILVLDRC